MTSASPDSSQDSTQGGAATFCEKLGVRSVPASARNIYSSRNAGLLSLMAAIRVIILPLVLVLLLAEAGRL